MSADGIVFVLAINRCFYPGPHLVLRESTIEFIDHPAVPVYQRRRRRPDLKAVGKRKFPFDVHLQDLYNACPSIGQVSQKGLNQGAGAAPD